MQRKKSVLHEESWKTKTGGLELEMRVPRPSHGHGMNEQCPTEGEKGYLALGSTSKP